MIATWRMAGDAIKLGAEILNEKGKCQDAVEKAIMQVEDYPFYKSVGYGGLPNEDCEVELDAAFMDGKTLSVSVARPREERPRRSYGNNGGGGYRGGNNSRGGGYGGSRGDNGYGGGRNRY